MRNVSVGVVYAVSRQIFVEEAIASFNSLRSHMPNVLATIVVPRKYTKIAGAHFDKVITSEPTILTSLYKVENMVKSQYEYTLYVDCDTSFVDDCHEVFELLDRFDLAIAQSLVDYEYTLPGVPDSFGQFNSGVIAFRRTKEVSRFFHQWRQVYIELHSKTPPPKGDETSLRRALYESDVSIHTLSQNYNYRIAYPNILSRNQKIKIVHGRSDHISKITSELNASKMNKVYLPAPEGDLDPYKILKMQT